jgi:hypothetical protein
MSFVDAGIRSMFKFWPQLYHFRQVVEFLSDNGHGSSDIISGGLKTMVRPVPQVILIQIPIFSLQGCALADTPGLATAMLVHM